jgi:hypothetical protein
MCNHLNLKVLTHILTVSYLVMIIIMRGENFVAHLDGLDGTPVAQHWHRIFPFVRQYVNLLMLDLVLSNFIMRKFTFYIFLT